MKKTEDVEWRRKGQRERYARRRKFETWVAVRVPNDELEVIKKWAERDKVSVREMVLTLVTWGMESADDRPNPNIGLGKGGNSVERSVVAHK